MVFRGLLISGCLLLASCGSTSPDELNIRIVKLPNGEQVRCEVLAKEFEIRRGMIFRDSVPRGTGMLFIYPKPGKYSSWMYQVKVPLDIIWIDTAKRVVEIVANAPPCNTKASECPTYGGHADAQYMLELGGGEAQRCHLREGDFLSF